MKFPNVSISMPKNISIPFPINVSSMSTPMQYGFILLFVVLFGALLIFIKNQILSNIESTKESPYILTGTKNAKRSLVISQDPSVPGSIPLLRSHNKSDAEFTYSVWLMVENTEYKYGEWKHVFHRGNDTGYPLRAPGVYFHPKENTIRVYMNTMNEAMEYVDIPNVPIKKWIHLGVVLRGNQLEVYFNGKLRMVKTFTSVPRQNHGKLWINLFGGFDGYLSRFRYFNYAVDYSTLLNIVKDGPNTSKCIDGDEIPPYLDDAWWFDL